MKKLFWMVAFAITFFTNCKNTSKTPDKEPQAAKVESKISRVIKTEQIYIKGRGFGPDRQLSRSFVSAQYVVSYCDKNAKLKSTIHDFLIRKGATLISTCDCSDAIELWSCPVEPSPDGTDVVQPPKGQGWDYVKNSMVYSNTDIDSLEGVKEGSFTLKDLYPPIKKPLNTVKLAIDDSGVKVENTLLRNHLFYNPVGTLFCNTSTKEGLNGMNILSRNDQSSNTEPADVDGHGTFISGVAAGIALPNDDRFVTDPAMINIKQIHAKIFNTRDEGGDLFSALCGIHYSIGKKVKIINASWAATTYTSEEADAMKQVFCPTMQAIKENNILLVAAAGNHSMGLDGDGKTWPACFALPSKDGNNFSDYVLSVGSWASSRDSDRIAYHSNFGTFVDVYAPGSDVISTGKNARTAMKGRGTSYAAPYISRIAAILRGLHPEENLPIGEIKKHILKYSNPENRTHFERQQSVKLLYAYMIMKYHHEIRVPDSVRGN